jgi:diguanylate cyclase (GGDEF)-like protein
MTGATEPITAALVGAAQRHAPLLAAAGMSTLAVEDAPGVALRADAVVFATDSWQALTTFGQRPGLAQTAFDCAVLLLADVGDDAAEAELIARGVQAVLAPPTTAGAGMALARAVRQAVARKRNERLARTAYATDLATGLPHQAQLVEHMTQLLALREREPAPMVLIVLRVQGYAAAAAQLGDEAANVLRRKVAVRLRSLLRASDVVAAIGHDAFGILLGRLEAPADGARVASKLVQALQLPMNVAGQACQVVASAGLALYPEHGKDANSLLQRASAQAGSLATLGGAGYASATERATSRAANDPA